MYQHQRGSAVAHVGRRGLLPHSGNSPRGFGPRAWLIAGMWTFVALTAGRLSTTARTLFTLRCSKGIWGASIGAPEWVLDAPNGGNGSDPWTQEEKDAVKACVNTYKARIRQSANLYHILPRPDGRNWDGTHPPCVKSATELMGQGVQVTLPGDEISELIFFEVTR